MDEKSSSKAILYFFASTAMQKATHAFGLARKNKSVRCGLIGYGPIYNFGKFHGLKIQSTEGLELTAVFSRSKERTNVAKGDFPEIETYNDVGAMLKEADIDLAVVITPHNAHAPIALECLRAGKHVIVEKAMCITVAEATAMIEAAKKANCMLAVGHNRRHDGNYRAIKEVVDNGVIGDVFHVEAYSGGYGHRYNWYADKEISGGALYSWGSHAVDWVLNLIPSRMVGVTGFFHKLVWDDMTNEDQARAVIHFENGAVADVTTSTLARISKPLWYILGTKGAITDTGADALAGYYFEPIGYSKGSFRMVTEKDGRVVEENVPYKPSDWIQYYTDIADHLLFGKPVPVSGEEGRRVIAVLETAEKSAKSGRTEKVPYE